MMNLSHNVSDLTLASYCCVVFAFKNNAASASQSEILERTKSCFDEMKSATQWKYVLTVIIDLLGTNTSIKFQRSDCDSIHHMKQCSQGIKLKNLLYICFLLLVFFVAFFGNAAVIASVFRSPALRKTKTNYFIASLAVSDLLVALFTVPIKIKTASNNMYFCSGAELCRFYVTFDNLLFVASITNLLAISIDRYMALEMPYSYPTKLTSKRAKFSILLIWCYALVWAIAVNFYWEHLSRSSISVTTPALECVQRGRIYVFVTYGVVFYLPVFVLGFVYARIFLIARRHANSIAKDRRVLDGILSQNGSTGMGSTSVSVRPVRTNSVLSQSKSSLLLSPERLKKPLRKSSVEMRHKYMVRLRAMSATAANVINRTVTLKVTKTVALVYGLFLICLLPVSILSIGLKLCPSCFQSNNPVRWPNIVFVEVLPLLNSTCNPFVYAFMSKHYRHAFRTLVFDVWSPFVEKARYCFCKGKEVDLNDCRVTNDDL